MYHLEEIQRMTSPANMLSPVNRSRLHEEIVSQIQDKIIRGNLVPGDKLPPERELALNLNVNRATVREAMKKLEMLGLVKINHGNGIYVQDYLKSGNLELLKAVIYSNTGSTIDILLQLLFIRRILTPEIAFLAAQNRTDTDLLDLRHVIDSESVSVAEADVIVHHYIARSSGNIPYIFILNFFNEVSRDYGHLYFDNEENRLRSRKFHCDIYKAIAERNDRKAKKIMYDVLVYTEEQIRKNAVLT